MVPSEFATVCSKEGKGQVQGLSWWSWDSKTSSTGFTNPHADTEGYQGVVQGTDQSRKKLMQIWITMEHYALQGTDKLRLSLAVASVKCSVADSVNILKRAHGQCKNHSKAWRPG